MRFAAINAALTIFAAASLTNVFPQIDPAQTYSFSGSNALASTRSTTCSGTA